MSKDIGASMTVHYRGVWQEPTNELVEESDAILRTCAACGHSQKDHYRERGHCNTEDCECSRYRGR